MGSDQSRLLVGCLPWGISFVVVASFALWASTQTPAYRLWIVGTYVERAPAAAEPELVGGDRQQLLEARVADLEAAAGVCRDRTDHLAHVLRTLITVWPGRAKLPAAPYDWAPWPEPGSHRWDYASLPVARPVAP